MLQGAARRAQTYERLEFLGDRVLGLAIAELLFEKFPRAEEGEMSRRFADLVRKETCPDRPAFYHPDFDHEHRIVTARLPSMSVASVYVPNGGKDFEAKMRFIAALDAFAAERIKVTTDELLGEREDVRSLGLI